MENRNCRQSIFSAFSLAGSWWILPSGCCSSNPHCRAAAARSTPSINSFRYGWLLSFSCQPKSLRLYQLWIGRKDSKVPQTFLIAHYVVTVVLMFLSWMHGCFSFSHPHPNKHILLSVWVTVYAQVIKSTVVQAKELSDIKQTEYQEHGCPGKLGRLSGEQKYPFPVVAFFFFPTTSPSMGMRHRGRLPRHVQGLWIFHILHAALSQVCWCSEG